MSGGLVGLLDDVAALAKLAAASVDDVGLAAGKASAKAAKDRAKQLKAQAEMGAERLDMQKSRQTLAQLQRSAVTSNVKPHN